MNQHIAREEVDASKFLTPEEARGVGAPAPFDPQGIRDAIAASTCEPRFALEPLDAIELDLGPQWLIPGLMPSNGLHVLYGAPGSGKSFLALSAALHVAAGKPWGGRPVRKGGVVYVAAEGGRGFRKRVVAARTDLGDLGDVRFALVTTAPNLSRGGDTTDLIEEIEAQTRRLGWRPALVVIDTLSRSVEDMNESSSQEVMAFVKNAERIGEHFDCVVMPVHHTGKDETKGMRGSSALHGSADAEWLVSRPDDSGARHLSVEKMKDGEDKARLRYELVKVDLGIDRDGHKVTSCVVKVLEANGESDQAGGERRSDAKFSRLAVIRTILRVLAATEGEQALDGSPIGRGKIVPQAKLKAALASSGIFSSDGALRGAMSRAIEALVKSGELSTEGEALCVLERPAAGAGAPPPPA